MINIRHANSSDVPRIYELIRTIANHHDQEQYVITSPGELLESGFGSIPSFGVILAEVESVVIGYLSYTLNYSIWLGAKYMNIDDVYVDSGFRGLKIGENLMTNAKKHCAKMGLPRMRWEVQDNNEAAIRFYKRLGATMAHKGIFSWNVN